MLKSFLRHYLELPTKSKNVVCLGGGVGTSQVLKALRDYPLNLTAVVSMADDGGSAGRLRRAFSVPPPGDLVNCLAALSSEESILNALFVYRFAGQRYGKDTDLGGQKLGNLIFVALTDIFKGDAARALEEFSRILSSKGRVLPATVGDVNIWAKTTDGKKIYGEQNIDLGIYDGGAKSLIELHLDPPNVSAYKPAIDAILGADIIIAGPGDLFSTVLPVLIVNQIKKALASSKANKFFIINTTNKSFETAGFKVSDYIKTLNKHLGEHVFDKFVVNTNFTAEIPKSLKYRYVDYDRQNLLSYHHKIAEGDFVDESYPIHHGKEKIAKFFNSIVI